MNVYTVGHGNRPLDELVTLLKQNAVRCIVDVRAFPGSRRHPHFGRDVLAQSLPSVDIDYVWEGAALGGRRRPRADSPHAALRNESFRAYADHMESDEFDQGLERLEERAAHEGTAVMCAERLPWQCHRFMIADALVARGIEVLHIIDAKAPRAHRLNAIARIAADGTLFYDIGTERDLKLD